MTTTNPMPLPARWRGRGRDGPAPPVLAAQDLMCGFGSVMRKMGSQPLRPGAAEKSGMRFATRARARRKRNQSMPERYDGAILRNEPIAGTFGIFWHSFGTRRLPEKSCYLRHLGIFGSFGVLARRQNGSVEARHRRVAMIVPFRCLGVPIAPIAPIAFRKTNPTRERAMAANAKLPARWDPLAILIADQRACANYIEARGYASI